MSAFDSPFTRHTKHLESQWAAEAKSGPKDTYVYRYFDADDQLLYVGVTANLKARHSAHKHRKAWFGEVARRTVQGPVPNAVALALEAWAIASESPLYNSRRSGGHRGPGSTHWDERMSAELQRLDAEQPGYLMNEMRLALQAAAEVLMPELAAKDNSNALLESA